MANKPGAKSNKSRNIVLSIVGGILLLLGAAFINFFIYPFTTTHPNFSDVEAVYNSIEVPNNWELISISEKTGPAGRSCYMGNDITGPQYCHRIRNEYDVPSVLTSEGYFDVMDSISCDNKQTEALSDTSYRFYCERNGVEISSSFEISESDGNSVGISVNAGD